MWPVLDTLSLRGMKPYKGALKKTLQRHWIGYFQGIYRESPFVYPIEEGDWKVGNSIVCLEVVDPVSIGAVPL